MKDIELLMENVQKIYLEVNTSFKKIIEADPNVARFDTCSGLLDLLSKINQILRDVNQFPVEDRAKIFNLTFNAVTYSSDIASIIRKSNYSFEVIKPLTDCILALEANIILQDVKYLDKRTRLYLDICQIYQENQCFQPALSLLDSAITKYKDLKATHEMDPPVPGFVETILNNNIKILKIMQIKYSIQNGNTSSNDWRKKVDEEFGDDMNLKLLSLSQCLKTQTRKQANIFQKNPHSAVSKNFKETLLQSGFDLVKPHADVLTKSLKEKKEKIERQVQFKKTQNITQELINTEIKKKRQFEEKNTKEPQVKKAIASFPFEYHAQLIHYAYEMKNAKILNELLQLALLRVECRRIQVPYITDIGVLASATPNPNIPNEYEKIPIDLNQANLKIQLKKLRKKGVSQGQQPKQPEPPKEKDPKKAGKEKPVEEKVDKDAPTQWQLEQIKHKYVFIIIKRSMSPENAIYKMDIVMGHEEEGPVGYMDTRRIIVPYIQEDMEDMESKVKQYKGAKQSTHMVPYIVLHHSKTGLEEDSQKQTIITDVQPIIGKNPMVPSKWGYHKVPVDLRQVPAEFIQTNTHDYVYLSYKNDESFFQNSRHVKILDALNALENSTTSDKANDITEEKLLQLGITYDLQKLRNLFQVMEECLQGLLGQEYYTNKIDFLTNLTFYLWTKYLRDPLIQFDYVNEMRLSEEIVDYDYEYYRGIFDRCKPIFLTAFKILNLILINNPKSDILFLSRVNLELVKLLEETQEYRIAGENAKLCMNRIRNFRDEYLSKGVIGSQDKLLPFSLTCSNNLLKETLSKMKEKFKEQRNYINKLKRIKERKAEKQAPLSKQELDEEEHEYLHYYKKDEIDEFIEKVPIQHSQLISIVMAIELDLSSLYFRVTLKHADYLKKQELMNSGSITNGVKEAELQGLGSTTKQKLKLPQGKTQMKNKKNLQQLQSTLINAKKLQAPKPGLHRSEKRLIEEAQKSPYLYSLLMTNFAAMNSKNEDKKYYLKESLKNVQKCYEIEKEQCQSAVQNSIFLFSTLWDNAIEPQKSSSSLTPFKEIYDGTWPAESQFPVEPILISKSSSFIVMKHPPYKKGGKKKVISMSLFGKPSANGVDVSHNCDELEGTGLKNKINEVVRVSNLKPNNIYCFASAATNEENELQPIGKTGKDIPTCHPLPTPMVAAYLAKVSYQISEYDVAQSASRMILKEYCQKSGYVTDDQRTDNINCYKFKEEVLNNVSLLEVRAISESLYILSLCERRKLNELKFSGKALTPIVVQEKEKYITNLLVLSSLLNPSMNSPIYSIPFLIPDSQIVMKAFSLTLIPHKWMNSKLKKLGVKVMEKVMKWGLETNEVSLARRILYKWSERKWMMLGKTIQVEEKKDAKKGGKEAKDQEVKMIDKYCRMLVEKSGGIFDSFEDSVAYVSQQYSDYVSMFVERAKEQISYYSQYVDNPPQELQTLNNNLGLKLDLVEYLKDPLNSIKKVPENSPFYLQFNCKIVKKALQLASQSEYKTLEPKIDELVGPQPTPEGTLANEIMAIMRDAVANDIEWSPSAKNEYIKLQQKTGKNLEKQITIYTNFQTKYRQLTEKISQMDSFQQKFKDFDYLNIWLSELHYLKGINLVVNCKKFEVKNPIKGKYQKINFMNLKDLLDKWKEVQVLEKQNYMFKAEDLERINKIMNLLCQSAFYCYNSQNWIKLQNILRVVFNFITFHQLTPFCHRQNSLWEHFAFLSILAILMLERIRKNGFQQFKKRYDLKMARTQIKTVANKLQVDVETLEVFEVFHPVYFLPELDPNTTKDFWFERESRIDLEAISSVIAYTVQSLRIQNKYNLVINITRDFCNATQHYYSLQLLPFMIQSQFKLRDQIKVQLDEEVQKLNLLTKEFTKKKGTKMKGQRQHKLSNQPLPYEIQYEEQKRKSNESLQLLKTQKNFIESQTNASQQIIEEIKRDTSKTVLKQREQRKFMLEFGEDEEHMFKNYGEDTRLAKNRKNAIRDIIDQYDKIYKELKSSKTSKDTLAEIQNRNDVGNLHFAYGSWEKAEEFWDDALAAIFKKVHPIENYIQVLNEKKVYLVNTVGEKQVLLAFSLLYKISKFGAFKKLNIQHQSMEFACHLAASLFEIDGSHPQNLTSHARYRMHKLSNKDSLADQTTINLNQLLSALQYFILRAIDSNKSINSLPLITLFEYVATDIAKSTELSMRSKILKAIALADCGLISQAIFNIAKAFNQKDLPNFWIDSSDNLQKEKGKNWCYDGPQFDNSKSFLEPQNKESLQFVKKLALKPEFTILYGLVNPILFNYGKGLILFKIHQSQIYNNYDTNEQRLQAIQQSQAIMRESLKKLSILHEHYENLQTVERARIKLAQNQLNEEIQKKFKQTHTAMVDYLKANGVQQALIKKHEEEKSTISKKISRIQMMARIRYSIYSSHASRRLYSNSYFVLKNGIDNLSRYAYEARKVELGQDPQIQPAQQSQGGKKEQKKGGKKEEEKAPISKVQIDEEKEKQMRKIAQNSSNRMSINAFWCLKMQFEIGKLMYQQNRFQTSINIFNALISECERYEEQYYKLYGHAYIQRSLIRLGKFTPANLRNIIQQAENRYFQGKDYIDLVMDFGQLLNNDEGLRYFHKGKEVSSHLWSETGMKSILMGLAQENPQRIYSGKDELPPDQEELIRRKGKKGDKKGGKQDKKAGKKEDPKKKKQQNKEQYKVKPLTTYEWWNLLDEEKHSFENYVLKPHPNLHSNNIYISSPLNYIKCYIRKLQMEIQHHFQEGFLEEVPRIEKLIKITESYPNISHYYLIHLHYVVGQMNKKVFLLKLNELIRSENTSKLKLPFQDVPLNNELIKLPSYSNFIFQNRKHLQQAQKWFHKSVSYLKNNSVLMENGFRLDDLLWKVSETEGYLAEYRGRLIPKYCALEIPAEAQQQDKLDYLNMIGSMFHHLDLSTRITAIIEELAVNYCQLGSKPLEGNAKIDQDISNEIIETDKEFKAKYPKFLADSIKEKQAINSVELIAFMVKNYRQAEYFTFSNSHLQNLIFKCHRILVGGLPAYKEKCLLSATEYAQKKSKEEKFVEKDTFIMKVLRRDEEDRFLYILGATDENEQLYYGKTTFNKTQLSMITEELYRIRSKMAISEKRSQAVKERDFSIYRKQLDAVLLRIGKSFNPHLKTLNEKIVALNSENLSVLIRMLESGTKATNKEIIAYIRHLHELKYKLIE